MATIDDIVRVYHIERIELTAWIEQRWVRPKETPAGLEFDDADAARIELIRELREDFAVNDDALGVVLSLLDQLYAARRLLKSVNAAIAALPEPMQAQVRDRLKPDR